MSKETEVEYTGDGNAFAILGYCQRLIEAQGGDTKRYRKEATSGNYNHLLEVSMDWTGVDFGAYYE